MISEIDIKDWELSDVKPLYRVTPKSYIKIEDGDVLFFDHLDGMYSYCLDLSGNVLHLAAWTDVHQLKRR